MPRLDGDVFLLGTAIVELLIFPVAIVWKAGLIEDEPAGR
jgi:hypothetical protein